MPNNHHRTSTIRELKHHGLVVRERLIRLYHPTEVVYFVRISCPSGVLASRILGNHVTYDTLDGCYHLDPRGDLQSETLQACRLSFKVADLSNSIVMRFERPVPCPKTQARVDVEWRQGRWMKYLEHERGWKEC